MVDKNLNHYVVVTAIIVNGDGKYLIAKRANWEKGFPGRWTVPGGKLEVLDYVLREKDTPHHWYNVLENTVRKEVREEVGLELGHLGYVTSLVYLRSDKVPCLIISLYAKAKTENVKLCSALTEYMWADLKEAKEHDLIEGIYEEIEILDKKLNQGTEMEWGKERNR